MKRSTSKKDSLLKPVDGSQQKISSFFQPGPVQAQNKLFTNITTHHKPPLTLKRQVSVSKSNTATTTTITTIQTGQRRHPDSGKHSMTVLKDLNSSSPLHESPQKSGPVDLPVQGSPEVVAIPDTPDGKLSMSWPKPASRSFLCPVSKLGDMPGKRASPPKVKQRKVVKKSLGPVIVEIEKKRLVSDGKKTESERKENSMVTEEGTKTCGSADTLIKTHLRTNSSRTGEMGIAKNDHISDFESDYLSSVSVKPHDCNTELPTAKQKCVQSLTPTKKSGDRRTVKRMAVQGLSPQPKRLLGEEAMIMNDDDDQSSKTLAFQGKVKVKRQLAALAGFKDVREMNQSLNHYQLGGSTKPLATTESSCTGDDVLADILGEMMDTTPQRKSLERKTLVPPTGVPTHPVVACNSVNEQSMETEASLDTAEDDVLKEILGELDSKLCQNQLDTAEDDVLKAILVELDSKLCQNQSRNRPQRKSKLGSSRNLDVATNKSEKKAKESIEPSVSGSEDWDGSSALTEPCESIEDKKGVMNDELGSRFHGSSNLKSCAGAVRANWTPTKTRNGRLNAQVKDSVNSELAGSFGRLSPFKKKSSARSSSQTPERSESSMKFTDKWNRYVVHSVAIDRGSHDKVLELSKEGTAEITRTAKLQGCWSDTHVECGDIVHLLLEGQEETSGKKSHRGNEDGPIIIDDAQGQIVVNPDLLLSGTTIVSGVYCLRRSILNEKFKGVDSKNVHMLYGSIIHSLFQEVLKDRMTKTAEIMAAARSIVKSTKFLHDMYGQSVTEVKVMEEIEAYVGPLQAWMGKHVPSVSQRSCDRGSGGGVDVSVVQIHDIEENIWSPRIGVKGKIDMTVEVEMQQKAGGRRRKVLPLELKTGKASYSVEHKGQVTLYSMMMSDRRQNPEEGLLLYLKHNDMSTVPVKPHNTQGLLQLRNEMAYYLSRQAKATRSDDGDGGDGGGGGGGGGVSHSLGPLPAPINNLRSCSKCPQLLNCAFYQSLEKSQHAPDHAMSSLVPEALSHLSDSHLSYFRHWLLCMDLETAAQRAEGLRNVWCMSSAEREAKGDCLQQLVMVSTVLGVPETQTFSEGKGCCVQFMRKPGFCGGALNGGGLAKNDSVVVSSEDGRYIALSTGFIKNITETMVDVVVDRDSFHENATFQSLVFRVDRCDAFNTAGYLLTNLSRLLNPSPHCQKLRSLIIDGRKPEFQLTMSKSAVEKVKKIFRTLNKPQKTAILKVLMSRDYVLIKGYPGTGKTSTIVALVKILRELGQSVLLTSYTHSAVDNILLKLKKDGVPFLRLGRCSRIHPDIVDHAAETLTPDITSVDQLRDFYSSYSIVATSCLGVNQPVFSKRRFDVCIVDEASQVLQPACLGPLFYADRFVLVGDPLQLPPVVQSKEASSLGMGESLFARLDGIGATYDLHLQYRMNSTIMQLSNELVYKGALSCGASAVSRACIQPHDLSAGGEAKWLVRALDTGLSNAVVFLDTCQISAPETSSNRGLTNEMEAALILRLCTTFVQAGISVSDIGVIAPYRAQVRALQQRLSDSCPLRGVEVNTVDQYQGRDKSVVCISFVRSSRSIESDSSHRGGLLRDVRRLNVAVTRAKHKLVMVGDSATLRHYPPLAALIHNLRSRNQIFPLPADLLLEETADL